MRSSVNLQIEEYKQTQAQKYDQQKQAERRRKQAEQAQQKALNEFSSFLEQVKTFDRILEGLKQTYHSLLNTPHSHILKLLDEPREFETLLTEAEKIKNLGIISDQLHLELQNCHDYFKKLPQEAGPSLEIYNTCVVPLIDNFWNFKFKIEKLYDQLIHPESAINKSATENSSTNIGYIPADVLKIVSSNFLDKTLLSARATCSLFNKTFQADFDKYVKNNLSIKDIICHAYQTLFVRGNGKLYGAGSEFSDYDLGIQILPKDFPKVKSAATGISVSGKPYSLILCEDGCVYVTVRSSIDLQYKTAVVHLNIGKIGPIKNVFAGTGEAFILCSNNTLYRFEINFADIIKKDDGQLMLSPNLFEVMKDAKEISAKDHCLILGNSGLVYAKGENLFGQLGDGTRNSNNQFNLVTGLPLAKKVVAGDDFSIVIGNDGSVWGFGSNACGRLGLDTPFVLLPACIMDLKNIVDVAVGRLHTLFLCEDGRVYGCGLNTAAQLGSAPKGINYLSNIPAFQIETITKPKLVSLSSPAKKVFAAGDHSFVQCEDGTIYGFGDNGCGQLGLGDKNDRLEITPLKFFNQWQQFLKSDDSKKDDQSKNSTYQHSRN